MYDNSTKIIQIINTTMNKDIIKIVNHIDNLTDIFPTLFDPPNFIQIDLQNISVYNNLLIVGYHVYNNILPLDILFTNRIIRQNVNLEDIDENIIWDAKLIELYRNQQIVFIKMYIEYGLDILLTTDKDINSSSVVNILNLIENQNIFIEKKSLFKENIYFQKIRNSKTKKFMKSKFNNLVFMELIGTIEDGNIINEILMRINEQSQFYASLCCIINHDIAIPELRNFLINKNNYFFSEEYENLKLFDISYHLNKKTIYYLLSEVKSLNYESAIKYKRNYANAILNNYNYSFLSDQMDNYLLYDVLLQQYDEIDNMSYLNFLFAKKRESLLIDIVNYLKEKLHRHFMYFLEKEEYIESVDLLFDEAEIWLNRNSDEEKMGYLIIKPKGCIKIFLSELSVKDIENLYTENEMDIPQDVLNLELNSSIKYNEIKKEYENFLKSFKNHLLKNEQIIKNREIKKLYNFKNYEETERLRNLQKNIISLYDFIDYHKNILAKDISMVYIKTKSCINENFFYLDIYAHKFIENILNLKYNIHIADQIIHKIYLKEKSLFKLIIENIMKTFPFNSQKAVTNKDSYPGDVETIKNLHFIAIFLGRTLNYGLIKNELYSKCIIFLKDCFSSRNIKIIELGNVVLDHYPLIIDCKEWENIILEYNLFNNLEKIDEHGNFILNNNKDMVNMGIEEGLVFEANENINNDDEVFKIIKLISNLLYFEELKENFILKFLPPFDNLKDDTKNNNNLKDNTKNKLKEESIFDLRNNLIEFHLKYENNILKENEEKKDFETNFIYNLFYNNLNEHTRIYEEIKERYLSLKLMNILIKIDLNLSIDYLINLGKNLGRLLNLQTLYKNKIYPLNIIDLYEYINILIENKKIILVVYFLLGFFENINNNPIFDLLAPFSNKYIKILSIINNNMNYTIKKDIKNFLDKIHISNRFQDIRVPNILFNEYQINKEYLKSNYYSYNNSIRLNPYLIINRNNSICLSNHLKNILIKNNLREGEFIYEISYFNSRYLKIISQEFVNYNLKENEKLNLIEKSIREQLESLNYNLRYKLKGSRLVQRVLKISIDFTISNIYADIKLKIEELLMPIMHNLIKHKFDFEEFYKNKSFEIKNLKSKIYGEKKNISYPLFMSCIDSFLQYLLINKFKVRLEGNIQYIFQRAKLNTEDILKGSFFKDNFKTFNYIFLSKISRELQIEMERNGFIFHGFGNKEYEFLFTLNPVKVLINNNKIIMNSKEIEDKIDILACHIPIEESTEINLLIEQIKEIFTTSHEMNPSQINPSLHEINPSQINSYTYEINPYTYEINNATINNLIKKLKDLPNLDSNCINIAEEFIGMLLKEFNIHLYSLILKILNLSFKTKCLISDWLIYSDDDRKLNKELVINLIKDGILNYQELDMFISRNLFTLNNEKIYQTFTQKKCLEFLQNLLNELPVYYFIQSIQQIEILNNNLPSLNLNEILLNVKKYGLEDIEILNFEESYKKFKYKETNTSLLNLLETSLNKKVDSLIINPELNLIKEGLKSSMISYLKGNNDISKYKRLNFLIEKYNGDILFNFIFEKLTEDLINQNYRFIDFYMFYILNSNNFERFLKIIDLKRFPVFALPILKILNSKISNLEFILISTFKSINSVCNYNSGCCYLINNKEIYATNKEEYCKCEKFKKQQNTPQNISMDEKDFINLNINLILLLKSCPIDFPQFFNAIFNYFFILKFHFPKFFVKNSVKFNFFLEEKYPQLKNLFCSVDLILCKKCECSNSNRIYFNDVSYSEEFYAKLNLKNIKTILNTKMNRIDLHYLIREISDINLFFELKKVLSEFNHEMFISCLVNNLGNKKPRCFDVIVELKDEGLNRILRNRLKGGNCTPLLKLVCKLKHIKIE